VGLRRWLAAGVIVLAAGIAIVVTGTSGGPRSAAAAQRSPVSTAAVRRRELTATVSAAGTLTYRAQADGSPYHVVNQARGTYTKLPAIGQVIRPGEVLYRVNDRPVVLPAGMTGRDVAELNADLVSLRYATSAKLSRTSASFGSATRAAVAKFQAAAGMRRTGRLTLGRVVFEPTAVRVTALVGLLGGIAHGGQTVLQGTSSARQVQLALDAAQQTDVAVGRTMSITLPNNRTTSGVVSSVGKVATCPSSSAPGGSGFGSGTGSTATGTCSEGGSPGSTPTITVDITPSDPAATGTWDQAAVQVAITTARVHRALVVPVNALLARSQGGYAVEVVGAMGTHRLVPVSLGLFDDDAGLVQVTGARLAAGQDVVVPAT
jgi:peptidoglycan hydrolase-like protein with peptidoglycan-binding domain